jgi:putative addiction module component (TIGR02574 family)
MVDAVLIATVKMLSPADRLELIRTVWETLSPSELPITGDEKAKLDERLDDLEANPADQTPWHEAQARLRRLLP